MNKSTTFKFTAAIKSAFLLPFDIKKVALASFREIAPLVLEASPVGSVKSLDVNWV